MNGQSWTKWFFPLPGGAVAEATSAGLIYRHPDWLGSSRLSSTLSRTIYYDGAYGPFGEPYAQSGTADVSFTGMNQDTAANFYDFPARTYSIQGRWPKPDPAGLGSADPTNPQSWNRYAYVLNQPLKFTDPTGMYLPCRGIDCSSGFDGGGGPPCFMCGGNGGGLGYDGGPSGCSLDGMQTACGNVNGLGSNGIAPCPDNACVSFNGNGQLIVFHAFAGLAEAVSGYYAAWGVGSLSYNGNQAGIAAAQWGIWYESQTGSEAGGSLWCAYGVCSSTLQQPGEPGAGSVILDFGFSDIPNGTDPAGWWRVEAGESPSGDLNAVDFANAKFGTSFSLYTGDFGDPGNPVLLYNKGINSGYECVLSGPVPSSGLDGPCQ